MVDKERDIEIRIIIRTEMSNDELDLFCTDVESDIEQVLLTETGEKLIGVLHTDKISYEGKQLLRDKGEL